MRAKGSFSAMENSFSLAAESFFLRYVSKKGSDRSPIARTASEAGPVLSIAPARLYSSSHSVSDFPWQVGSRAESPDHKIQPTAAAKNRASVTRTHLFLRPSELSFVQLAFCSRVGFNQENPAEACSLQRCECEDVFWIHGCLSICRDAKPSCLVEFVNLPRTFSCEFPRL